jgi:outer membrane lipoprotein-sorting protein
MRRRKNPLSVWLLALVALGVASPPAAEAGPSAREVMDKAAVARKLDGAEALMKMTIDDHGQVRERKLTMATKLYDAGKTEKRIFRFLSPADVKGTGVLVFDYDASADDVWLFIPALRKTRRVVSSQRSQSFMGSEFSYGDLNIPALDEFEYHSVKEESVAGEDCYVIDVTPKSPETASSEGYSKKTVWVSKKTFAIFKALYFDLSGKVLKELASSDIKLVDPKNNRYRAMRMEMTNKQTGRRSVFETEKIALAPETKDEYFTPRYLERP